MFTGKKSSLGNVVHYGTNVANKINSGAGFSGSSTPIKSNKNKLINRIVPASCKNPTKKKPIILDYAIEKKSNRTKPYERKQHPKNPRQMKLANNTAELVSKQIKQIINYNDRDAIVEDQCIVNDHEAVVEDYGRGMSELSNERETLTDEDRKLADKLYNKNLPRDCISNEDLILYQNFYNLQYAK